jgi:4-hydroxy-tetrahydrodipicolinate synthase
MDQAAAAPVKASARQRLSGVWAAIFTPFQPDGALDLQGAAANARAYGRKFALDGVFCNGIMGEGWSLALDERRAVLEAVLDGAGDRLRVGVVVTHHALSETLALARHAADAGADHIVLMRPRGPWSGAELTAYAEATAEAAGRSITLFESTAPGMGFGPDMIEAFARTGCIHGIKATGGVKAVQDLRRRFPDLTIADPHEDQWLTTLLSEGDQPLYADPEPYLYRVNGDDVLRRYQRAALSGDHAAAIAAWQSLAPLRKIYDQWIIGPLDQGRSPAAALKHWAARRDLAAGPVRFPLKPLSDCDSARLTQQLEAADTRAALTR